MTSATSSSSSLKTRVRDVIRDIPDFPKPGIVFKDITPLLEHGPLFKEIIDHLEKRYRDRGLTSIVAIESRGFIFGAPLANALGIGLTLMRKPGKLPSTTLGVNYTLEYGTDRLEIHADALNKNSRVVLIDDLLATGGTAAAARELIESTGATLEEAAFLIELSFLPGREALKGAPLYSLISY